MSNKKNNSGFTLVELLVIMIIIGILASIGLGSFNTAQMKSRDSKRKTNLQQISNALEIYYNDKGQYPSADAVTGKIAGCGNGATEICNWGSEFSNTATGTVYMTKLPADPLPDRYIYSYRVTTVNSKNGKYQLYAHLENSKDKDIIVTNAVCSPTAEFCNYGVSSGNTLP